MDASRNSRGRPAGGPWPATSAWLLTVSGATDLPPLPPLDDVLFELIFGMLGLGMLRSADRWNRMKAMTK